MLEIDPLSKCLTSVTSWVKRVATHGSWKPQPKPIFPQCKSDQLSHSELWPIEYSCYKYEKQVKKSTHIIIHPLKVYYGDRPCVRAHARVPGQRIDAKT